MRRVLGPQLEVGTRGACPIEELLDGGVLEQGGQGLTGLHRDVEGPDRVLLLLAEVRGAREVARTVTSLRVSTSAPIPVTSGSSCSTLSRMGGASRPDSCSDSRLSPASPE